MEAIPNYSELDGQKIRLPKWILTILRYNFRPHSWEKRGIFNPI